jgi:acyl transferase domain-containing protein
VQGVCKLVPAYGILGDVDLFDADFFGFNPREAEIIDPQQRLFLEHAWMAMEDAGYVGETYPGLVGVYAGAAMNTYILNNVMAHPEVVNALGEFQTMIANDKDFLATRVAYKLNLKGPAVTVQTACSTSLVAIHTAKQALLNGECDMALAGGVAVSIPEKSGYFYNEGGYLSPDGHCRAFAANANGTMFGNGIGVVVLKPLEKAVRDSDFIYGIIKGSAANNDGSLKVGYTSPSEIGQANAILQALKESGVNPDTVGYVETHGTGTVLGDPVEMAALNRAFAELLEGRENKTKNRYCAVASLKSNVGHLDIAAGVIGLIKAVLCLRHKQIPPSINAAEPNPMIDFANTPFYVNRVLADWPSIDGTPRRAGVSSFGIGGTNVHVVVEEWPEDRRSDGGKADSQVILLSAGTEDALHQVGENLVQHLKKAPQVNLADVAYVLAVGRKAFEHRLAVVCSGRDDAIRTLEDFDPKRIVMHTCREGEKSLVFMFPGIGEHYVNMTAQLYDREPVFREEVDRCCDILEPILGRDLREVLYVNNAAQPKKHTEGIDLRKLLNRETENVSEEESILSQTIYSHTAVFTVEYALARLLMSWGIKPYAMIGYSLGEYTAACVSGVFSLADVLSLVAERAKLIHSLEQGAMAAVSMPEAELEPLVEAVDGVSIAAVNTPDLCIVSGKLPGVQALEKQLQQQKVIFRRLKAFQAFHSRMMEAVRPRLTALFKKIIVNANPPVIPYISNVTGTWITAEQVTSADYWITHTVSPIRFSRGIGELLSTTCNFFLEVGPGNSLCGFTAQHPKNKTVTQRFALASLPKESENVSDKAFLLRTLGKLWAAGMDIDWRSFYRNHRCRRIPLPTYPFARKRYWLEPGAAAAERDMPATAAGQIAKIKTIDEWFYVPCWKQSVPPLFKQGKAAAAGEKRWLIFADESPVSTRLIQQLKLKSNHPGNENEMEITAVKMGDGFEKSGARSGGVCEHTYTIHPGRYEDYAALLEELREQDRGFDTIVHLWLLTPTPAGEVSDLLDRGVYSLLYLVKAMGCLSMFDKVELWMVTNHVHQIESSDMCSPGKTAILGPCNVISQEYPNILCRSIDIGVYTYPYVHARHENARIRYDEETAALVEMLLAEFNASPPDRVIAYRGPHRWVQGFEPVRPPKFEEFPAILKEEGVYLITGGLGRIGLTIAEYLARNLRAKLVLTSRSGVSLPGKGERIRQLEEMGSEVLVVQADASDLQQMKTAVQQAEERFGKIYGVVHAAGVMDPNAFKLIADLDKEHCRGHFNAKIRGTLVLEEIFRDKDLDFCLLTSSLSPLLGGLSLYAYSAANGFMDGFAIRQSLVYRKNWISIDWADWEPEEETGDGEHGMNTMVGTTTAALNITPDEGKETFARVLAFNRLPQIVVSSGDLHRRLRQWVTTGIGDADKDTDGAGGRQKQTVHKRPRLQSIYESPKNEAEKIVSEIWQELLGIELVGVHDNFFELGGHSLIATRLISRLREIFRIDIPLPTLFDRPTIREVVDNIAFTWGDAETVENIARTYREVQSMS